MRVHKAEKRGPGCFLFAIWPHGINLLRSTQKEEISYAEYHQSTDRSFRVGLFACGHWRSIWRSDHRGALGGFFAGVHQSGFDRHRLVNLLQRKTEVKLISLSSGQPGVITGPYEDVEEKYLQGLILDRQGDTGKARLRRAGGGG